jgi:hypothetical protein
MCIYIYVNVTLWNVYVSDENAASIFGVSFSLKPVLVTQLFGLVFDPEYELFRNVGKLLPHHTASHSREVYSSPLYLSM